MRYMVFSSPLTNAFHNETIPSRRSTPGMVPVIPLLKLSTNKIPPEPSKIFAFPDDASLKAERFGPIGDASGLNRIFSLP